MGVHDLQFYVDGKWVEPATPKVFDVIDPATEAAVGQISMGSEVDVDRAVAAASRAFRTFGRSARNERIDLLKGLSRSTASAKTISPGRFRGRWARLSGLPMSVTSPWV